MSTRGTIAVKDASGYVLGIYLHSDSYLENAGEILLNHYNTLEKVAKLISNGACSVLYENIGEKHDFEDWEYFHKAHCCKFYHRDKEERLEILKAKSVEEFYDRYSESNDYLFDNGVWYVCTFEFNEIDEKYDNTFIPLEEAIKIQQEEAEKQKQQD